MLFELVALYGMIQSPFMVRERVLQRYQQRLQWFHRAVMEISMENKNVVQLPVH